MKPTMIEATRASEHNFVSELGLALWFRVLGHLCYIDLQTKSLHCDGFKDPIATDIQGDISIGVVRRLVEFEIGLYEDNL